MNKKTIKITAKTSLRIVFFDLFSIYGGFFVEFFYFSMFFFKIITDRMCYIAVVFI